jgi:hypothetical protein
MGVWVLRTSVLVDNGQPVYRNPDRYSIVARFGNRRPIIVGSIARDVDNFPFALYAALCKVPHSEVYGRTDGRSANQAARSPDNC